MHDAIFKQVLTVSPAREDCRKLQPIEHTMPNALAAKHQPLFARPAACVRVRGAIAWVVLRATLQRLGE